MDDKVALEFMNQFEKNIIILGLSKGICSDKKKIVPLRTGKLDKTDFGKFIGKKFKHYGFLAIDYYGHYKLSSGILDKVKSIENTFPDIRCIKVHVVHFSSIKIEQIENIAGKKAVSDFVEYKKKLVALRWSKEKLNSGG